MFNFQGLIKYLLEGMAVAVAAFFIPQKKVEVKEIVLIALTAAAVFAILDQFSPSIGAGARQGAGIGIGLNQVGWGNDEELDGGYYYANTTIGPDKVNCTCEIDANLLRERVCPVHTPPSSTPVASAPSAPPVASKDTTKQEQLKKNTTMSTELGNQPPSPKSDTSSTAAKMSGGFDDVQPFDGFSKTF